MILFDFLLQIIAGSLITSRHVLSAAHCMNPDLFFARFAEHDVRTEADGPHLDVPIAQWEQHAGWNTELLINDIAMIRLELDIIFNGNAVLFKVVQSN